MSKPNGSEIFGTTVVRTDEYILLASVMVENGSSIPRADLDIMATDTTFYDRLKESKFKLLSL